MQRYKGNWETFAEKMVQRIGECHGYNNEISTEEQVPDSVIQEIYKGLWKRFRIHNVHLVSFYCKTCEGYHKETPFHLDTNTLLDVRDEKVLNSLNRAAWTDEKIKEVEAELDEIQAAIVGVEPDPLAKETQEAYEIWNELDRIVEEVSYSKVVRIQKEFYEVMRTLPEEKIQHHLANHKQYYEVVEGLKRKYELA